MTQILAGKALHRFPVFFIGLMRLKENLHGFQGDLGINFLMICFLKLNNWLINVSNSAQLAA